MELATHQHIVLGMWGLVVTFILYCFASLLSQFIGVRGVIGIIMGVLIMRVAPVLLIGYTIWAFWP